MAFHIKLQHVDTVDRRVSTKGIQCQYRNRNSAAVREHPGGSISGNIEIARANPVAEPGLYQLSIAALVQVMIEAPRRGVPGAWFERKD